MNLPRLALYAGLAFLLSPVLTGISYGQGGQGKQGITLVSSDPAGIRMVHTTTEFAFSISGAGGMLFTRLHVPGHIAGYLPGFPELPQAHAIIEIPLGASIEIRQFLIDSILVAPGDSGFSHPLYPYQPGAVKNLSRRDTSFYFDSLAYAGSGVQAPPVVRFEEMGTMRGSRLGRIIVSPFRYNPAKHLLTVYRRIEFEIRFLHPDPSGTRSLREKYYSPEFEPILKKALNYETPSAKAPEMAEAITYVILSDSMFSEAIEPLVKWKTRKGFRVIELYRGSPEAGNTAEDFRNALSQLYHSPPEGYSPPGFLLIVGDIDQIPSSTSSGHVSDLYYACYDGEGDYLPELFYGRFSANSLEELVPQIEKTLEYEQYLFPDPSFLNEAVMIAGVDAAYAPLYGNGHINYATGYYINPGHGLSPYTYLYPESGSSAEEIKNHIGNGVGFVNYTGHGSYDRWENPGLSIADIPSLNNLHRYPLMIGNGCETSSFGNYSCLGEALLRAEGRGALGYIGGSNDSYWDEDYYWAVGVGEITVQPLYEETGSGMYDKVFHEGGEPDNTWAPTQGQMVFAGNMAVQEGSLQLAKYYWEIYHLLGDPSLMPYFSVPDSFRVGFFSEVPTGTTYLNVNTQAGAYAALSGEDSLLAAAYAGADGIAVLHFDALMVTDTLELVVTGQNRIPIFGKLIAGNPDSAFLSIDTWSVSDTAGNGNGLANPGEKIGISLVLKNIGLMDAGAVQLQLESTDTLVHLLDSTGFVAGLQGLSQTTLDTVFRVQISDGAEDMETCRLRVKCITEDFRVFDTYLDLRLHAPQPFLGPVTLSDSLEGNGNRRMDPGERLTLRISAGNSGSGELNNAVLSLHTPDGLTPSGPMELNYTAVDQGETIAAAFDLEVSDTLLPGSVLPLAISWGSGLYTYTDTLLRYAGVDYEDFETGDFSQFPWTNDPEHPWEISESEAGEGSYSLKSPGITHLGSSQISLDLYFLENDTIHLLRKVSSEKKYDFLRVYLDENLKAEWSGEIPWGEAGIPVEKGFRKIRFVYSKDQSISSGNDCALIDLIRFPGIVFRPAEWVQADTLSGNLNHTVEAGENPVLLAGLKNPGITEGHSVTALVHFPDTLIRPTDSLFVFPGVLTSEDSLLTASFSIQVHSLTADRSVLPLVITLTDSTRGSWKYHAMITVNAPDLAITSLWWNDSISGNGNRQLDPGETMYLRLNLMNAGHSPGIPASIQLQTGPEYSGMVSLPVPVFETDTLLPGETFPAVFRIDAGESSRHPYLPFTITHPESGNRLLQQVFRSLGHPTEDFEQTDPLAFHWITGTESDWEITSGNAAEGKYSLQSPVTGHGQSSPYRLVVESDSPDSVYFFRKVSSERNYDFLRFSVNGEILGNWSGTEDWIRVGFPMPAGLNILEWTYTKDGNTTGGEDRAWIDYLVLPAESRPVTADLEITGIPGPENDSVLGPEEQVKLEITNRGNVKLSHFTLGYSVNQGYPVEEQVGDTLGPGESLIHEFTVRADLSVKGSYRLETSLAHPADWHSDNDTASLLLENISPVFISDPESPGGLQLFPQPADELLNILFRSDGTSGIILSVSDMGGKVLIQEDIAPDYGKQTHTLYLHTLKPGVYLLQLRQGPEIQRALFIRK